MDKKLSTFAKASADKRRQRYYTFMIVPHDASGKPISFRISSLWVNLTLGVTAFSLLFVASSFIYSAYLTRRLVNYHATISKNQEQMALISTFSREKAKVSEAINELQTQDNQLRKLLGLSSWKSKIKLSGRLDSKLLVDSSLLADRQQSLDELKSWVKVVRDRYAQTPSRWPIYGQVVSFFGYRTYPWTGFHSGLDISGRFGAPIHATANGTVKYAGWMNGYGKAVIVDHGFGRSTLYGHCSKLLVAAGEKITKGQIIANVGSTGHSTGPHLHYEVRKGDRAINPTAYLNLNMLSASKIWRD